MIPGESTGIERTVSPLSRTAWRIGYAKIGFDPAWGSEAGAAPRPSRTSGTAQHVIADSRRPLPGRKRPPDDPRCPCSLIMLSPFGVDRAGAFSAVALPFSAIRKFAGARR